jgi:hypothetical protein
MIGNFSQSVHLAVVLFFNALLYRSNISLISLHHIIDIAPIYHGLSHFFSLLNIPILFLCCFMHCLSQPLANERLKYKQQKIESNKTEKKLNKIEKKLSIFFAPFDRTIIFCAAFVPKMINKIFFEHLVSRSRIA